MHLHKLVVQSCVRYRREMKNGIELFVAELIVPIERCQILRYEIATVAGEILEIAGTKIVDHREMRVRKFFLQSEREIGADEAGSTGDDDVGRRVS
jgi:hypothetical protein